MNGDPHYDPNAPDPHTFHRHVTMTERFSPVVERDTEQLADLARKLIELTQEGNGAAAMSLLEQAAGVADG